MSTKTVGIIGIAIGVFIVSMFIGAELYGLALKSKLFFQLLATAFVLAAIAAGYFGWKYVELSNKVKTGRWSHG